MILRRCFNIQAHIDRVGQFVPGVVAIYLGDRAVAFADKVTDECHPASSETRFGARGVIELSSVPVVVPAGHPSRMTVL